MGAAEFITHSTGKDANDAFHKAVEHALYMSGHGGYTGTIAEKSSFIEISPPDGMTGKKFAKLVQAQENIWIRVKRVPNAPNLHEWVVSFKDKTGKVYTTEDDDISFRAKTPLTKTDKLFQPKKKHGLAWQPIRNRDDLKAARELKKQHGNGGFYISRMKHDFVENAWDKVSDKWGPAGCIQLSKTKFLFFGWASC